MFEDSEILTVDVLDDPPGLEIIDQLERLRYQLWTGVPVSPMPIDPNTFHFPISNAFAITTETLSIPVGVSVCIRDSSGEMIANVGHLEDESVGEGQYILELGAQIKTYVELDGPFDITSDLLEKEIAFEDTTQVRIGIRSRHERPAATVTTTTEPLDMMAAVSTFGSALKATNPERSYPTLRGHPPNIELGNQLDIPESVRPPETGIQIEIPETIESIYTVSPLAYYLGAELKPGPDPRVVTETGFEYPLNSPAGLEQGVERTLKQLFTLDCVTRVNGLYNIDLHERNRIEKRVDLDFETLYDSPLSEQLAAYLSIPYSTLEDCIPTWRLTTHVQPVPSTIEQLPFVINDLSLIHIAETLNASEPVGMATAQTPTRGETFTRSTTESSTRSTTKREDSTEQYVEPTQTDSLEQAWIGDGVPIGATKLTKQAFKNWFDREKMDGDISITIVVNDAKMNEERDLVNQVYGDRDDLPFDIKVNENVTVEQFRSLLREHHSFLHYIGHIEKDGFKCADGLFDASTLDTTGVDSFMLNACDSYQQGLYLINAGAIGGIVTLNDVVNKEAVSIGETIARLLNAGFPLDTSLSISRGESIFGGQYIVVGNSGLTVTQQPSRVPHVIEIVESENPFEIKVEVYPSNEAGLGTIFIPHIPDNSEYFIGSGDIGQFKMSSEQFSEFLGLQEIPVKVGTKIRWSSSIEVSKLL